MSTLQKFLSVKEHEESISNLYMRRNCTNSLFSILRNSMCPLKKTLRMCQMFLRVAPLFLMRTKPLYFMHINLCFSITNETRVWIIQCHYGSIKQRRRLIVKTIRVLIFFCFVSNLKNTTRIYAYINAKD